MQAFVKKCSLQQDGDAVHTIVPCRSPMQQAGFDSSMRGDTLNVPCSSKVSKNGSFEGLRLLNLWFRGPQSLRKPPNPNLTDCAHFGLSPGHLIQDFLRVHLQAYPADLCFISCQRPKQDSCASYALSEKKSLARQFESGWAALKHQA